MLVKVSQHCARGCSHCMEGSTVAGGHMTRDTFLEALEFTARVEALAWRRGCFPTLLFSGGECTDHPEFIELVQLAVDRGYYPCFITHGMWLADPERRAAILRPEWTMLLVQVTYDPRFYPPPGPPRVDDQRVVYIEAVTKLVPLGRAARRPELAQRIPTMRGPPSFNFRSMTRALGSIEEAVAMLRMRAVLGHAGQCTPSVNVLGEVMAGETTNCFRIGTVRSSNVELTRAVLSMQCNRCGLEDNLTTREREAIGLFA